MSPIYLDYNATAPLRPQAHAAVMAAMDHVGNASSVHGFGRKARASVEAAREHVASLVGARARDVIFTGSGTEANNHVLKAWPDRHLFVSAIEHDSIRDVETHRQTLLPVGKDGRLDVEASVQIIEAYVGPCVVAVMMVNNETGIKQPVAELVASLRALNRRDMHVHCDAVQAAGKMWIDLSTLDLDSLALSAHKIGGLPGVGALVHRPGLSLPRLLDGGGQERRQRAGTENIPGIAAFGAAADQCLRELGSMAQLKTQRNKLVAHIRAANPRALFLSENNQYQLGTTINVALPGVKAETLVMRADLAGLAISAGAACSSGKVNFSPVALAMGYDQSVAEGSVRLSIGWATNEAELVEACHRLDGIFAKFTNL